ncbi:MAG: hypothetical protein QM765_32640 [Myxococcales bacterium]
MTPRLLALVVLLAGCGRTEGHSSRCQGESAEALCARAAEHGLCGALRLPDSCGRVNSLTCPCLDAGVIDPGFPPGSDAGSTATHKVCTPDTSDDCRPVCSQSGFCWEFPRPMGDLQDIHGVAANDLWVVGASGITLHWDGVDWWQVDSEVNTNLEVVRAFGPRDVWAVGETTATLRWNGRRWSPTAGGHASALWGASSSDVWTAGFNFFHWDGATWQPDNSTDDWALALETNLWGSSSHDIWLLSRDRARHYDGTSWTAQPSPYPEWQRLLVRRPALAGTGPTDIWTGTADTLRRWDGSSWREETPPSSHPITAAFSRGSDLWLLSSDELHQRDAGGWASVLSLPAGHTAERLWTDGSEFWFARPGLLRWSGGRFSSFTSDEPVLAHEINLFTGWGSAGDYWALGFFAPVHGSYPIALHWDGTRWTDFDLSGLGESFDAIEGCSGTDVWVVGREGAIAHWDGSRWSAVTSPTQWDLSDVRVLSPSDAWAVGQFGTLIHWDGDAWSLVPVPTDDSLGALWVFSANDLWIASISNDVLHWDGKSWTHLPPTCPLCEDVMALFGAAPDDLLANVKVGYSSGLFHWDGATWTDLQAGGSYHFCGPRHDVWIPQETGDPKHWDGVTVSDYAWAGSYGEEHRPIGCTVDPAGDLWVFRRDGGVLRRPH